MLKHLSITNYLLIDRLELDLDRGFTAITGETGSGKSILIGALGLAMGERADASLARDATKRCIVELELELDGPEVEAWCMEHGVPVEQPFLLRRQVDPGGRSRAFVNDTPVRVEHLRALGARAIHVHSQHHSLLLNEPRFQLGLLDQAARQAPAVDALRERHRVWRTLRNELEQLRAEEARARAEQDYLLFQLRELQEAALVEGEEERITADLARAEHAGEILQVLQAVHEGLMGEEGLVSAAAPLRQRLAKPGRMDAAIGTLEQRLESALIELRDIAEEADRLAATVSMDPAEADRLRERLDLILRLQQKHRTNEVAGLLALHDELERRTRHFSGLGERIAALGTEERELREQVAEQAARISAARLKAMPGLVADVQQRLAELGLPHARLRFDHRVTEPGPDGIDAVRLAFSADPDRPPAPLDKVASGGEMSRVMLALIDRVAESHGLPTVVFDEIDTGVSGAVADRVGMLLRRMAAKRQVVAITHLPQIASKAELHLEVSKDADARPVRSSIDRLVGEQRVQALARMLSGRKTTRAALENARELLRGEH